MDEQPDGQRQIYIPPPSAGDNKKRLLYILNTIYVTKTKNLYSLLSEIFAKLEQVTPSDVVLERALGEDDLTADGTVEVVARLAEPPVQTLARLETLQHTVAWGRNS